MITHDVEAKRFTYDDGQRLAVLEYRRRIDRLVIMHTAVPPELEGEGVGGQLVSAAIDYAVERELIVAPICPFARSWLGGHPEVAELATIDWPQP